jgi:hypothetical protein
MLSPGERTGCSVELRIYSFPADHQQGLLQSVALGKFSFSTGSIAI